MTRPTMFCESCESTVYTDDVHSCYDAKAVRAQQERQRKLAAAVVEAAEAWEFAFRDPADPLGYEVDDKHDALLAAVRAYKEFHS